MEHGMMEGMKHSHHPSMEPKKVVARKSLGAPEKNPLKGKGLGGIKVTQSKYGIGGTAMKGVI